jgi:hypothetical protein
MRSRMRAVDVLEIGLEVGIVPGERVDREIYVLFRERGVDHQIDVYGLPGNEGEHSSEEGLKDIISADAVRDGVSDSHILETAGSDLEIVFRVTPRPQTVFGGIGKDRCVFKVRSIYIRVRADIRILLA